MNRIPHTPPSPPQAQPQRLQPPAAPPGQAAKALKAQIAATGAPVPANIQGQLASGLARGTSAEALFQAFAAPPPVTEPGAAGELPTDATATEPPEPQPDTETAETEAAGIAPQPAGAEPDAA